MPGWVYGKGQPAWHRSLYNRWYDMWKRCNDPNDWRYENYKDCPIDERYRYLSNYVNDVELLDNIELLKEEPSKWFIDKDKLDPNNRCYFFEHLSIISINDSNKERNNRRGKPNPPKPLLGINIDDNTILIFKSCKEAEDAGYSGARRCANGEYTHSHRYKWYYLYLEDREV